MLVTSVNPLVVWYYSDYYLRFSSREYSGDDFARGKEVDGRVTPSPHTPGQEGSMPGRCPVRAQ